MLKPGDVRILVWFCIVVSLNSLLTPAWAEIPNVFEGKKYYSDLQVTSSATPEVIDSAWKRLRRQYHPDHNPNDLNAEARFKAAKEAYEILSDPMKRGQYDTYVFWTKSKERARSWFAGIFGWAKGAQPATETKREGVPEVAPEPPRDTFKDFNNEDVFRSEWEKIVAIYLSVPDLTPALARAKGLSQFLEMTLKEKAGFFSDPLHKQIISEELNKFVRKAWETIPAGDLTGSPLHHTSQIIHSLYLSLNSLRTLQKRNELDYLTDVPRYVLHTAFLTALTNRERALVVAHSESTDLTTGEYSQWIANFSWLDRHRLKLELEKRILRLDPFMVVNYDIWNATHEELKGPRGRAIKLVLECSDYLGHLSSRFKLDRDLRNNK